MCNFGRRADFRKALEILVAKDNRIYSFFPWVHGTEDGVHKSHKTLSLPFLTYKVGIICLPIPHRATEDEIINTYKEFYTVSNNIKQQLPFLPSCFF